MLGLFIQSSLYYAKIDNKLQHMPGARVCFCNTTWKVSLQGFLMFSYLLLMFAHSRDTLDKYSLELANVSAQLFKFMANNLGVNKEGLLGTFKGLPQSMRINYYPPCSQANKVLGLSPHTDGVGMTFLLQVNDVEGLQIRKDGKWFSVKAIPGALVVNIGDALEVF